MTERLVRGTQILLVPDHMRVIFDEMQAAGRIIFSYPSGIQPGFVVSGPVRSTTFGGMDTYFCRYWTILGSKVIHILRTRANSEATHQRNLVVLDTVPTAIVRETLEGL